jgi:hypothetical protein
MSISFAEMSDYLGQERHALGVEHRATAVWLVSEHGDHPSGAVALGDKSHTVAEGITKSR